MNRYHFISGAIGAVAVILVGLIVITWMSPIDVAPVYMLNPEVALDSIQTMQLDSLRCEHLEVLRDLESKGVLLSPADYTSHISSFYNGLIAFLIGIFALFTFGGLFAVRFTNKKEIDEIKQDLKNETREHIITQLQTMMNDSRAFQETTLNSLTGRFEDRIITQEQLDEVEASIEDVKRDIKKHKESIDMLYEYYNEFEDLRASNENISEE